MPKELIAREGNRGFRRVTATIDFSQGASGSSATPVIVVSSDSRVGPRMQEDLRPYCRTAHLHEPVAFTAEYTRPEGGIPIGAVPTSGGRTGRRKNEVR
jgi:hypothetical protein